MATLVLTKVWVNNYYTGVGISAFSNTRSRKYQLMKGEQRVYGQGRIRSVTTTGVTDQYTITLVLVSAADCATLRGWLGQTVQMRDVRGQLFVGTIFEVDTPMEYRDQLGMYDQTFVLYNITVPAGV